MSARNASYLLLMAGAYRACDRDQEAARTYRALLELDPGDAGAMQALEELDD